MKYNIKVSKLEDGSYKLKINNYSRYEVEEVEALAIKYLQTQLQQKENIIKKVREYITYWHYRNDFRINSFTTGVKEELLEILGGENNDK